MINRAHLTREWLGYFPAQMRDDNGDPVPLTIEFVWETVRRNFPPPYPNPFLRGSEEYGWVENRLATEAQRQDRKYAEIPDAPIVPFTVSKRRMEQPVFKFHFDTLHDIQLRLRHTLIFVGARLFYVRDIVMFEQDFLLLLENETGQLYKLPYKSEFIDLRSPEPQYLQNGPEPVYLLRPPYRQQRQGIMRDNISCRLVGRQHNINLSTKQLMQGISTDINQWVEGFTELMIRHRALPSLRLSKNVAFFVQENTILAEYRGRLLGEVHENTVTIDEYDMHRPWIVNNIRSIGCTPRVQ